MNPIETEEGARRTFSELRPALARAASVVAARGGPGADALLAELEAAFVARRRSYTGAASVSGWLAAMLPRLSAAPRGGCPDPEALARQVEAGSPPAHAAECAACSAATAAVRAATGAPAGSDWDKETRPSLPRTPSGKAPSSTPSGRGASITPSGRGASITPSGRGASITPSGRKVARRRLGETASGRQVAPSKPWIAAAAGVAILAAAVVAWRVPRAEPTEERHEESVPATVPARPPAPRIEARPAPVEPLKEEPARPEALPVDAPPVEAPDAPPAAEKQSDTAPRPAPPAVASATSTAAPERSPMKLNRVSGNLVLKPGSGAVRALPAGPLEVAPEDRLVGDGSIDIDGKRLLVVDAGTVRARVEGKRVVVSVDSGSTLVNGSELTVETPEGSLEPDGSVAVRVAPKDVALTVIEGRALLHTRSKDVEIGKGESANLKNGAAQKHRTTQKELERARALARRPVLLLCAAAKERPWEVQRGRTAAVKTPCGQGQAFQTAKTSEFSYELVIGYQDERAPPIPLRGTVQLRVLCPPLPPGLKDPNRYGNIVLQLVLDEPHGETSTCIALPAFGEWQAVSVPVSSAARRTPGAGATTRLKSLSVVGGFGDVAVDHIEFNADSEAERSDCEETVYAAFKCQHAPKNPRLVEAAAGRAVLPFELRAGSVSKEGFAPDERGTLELVPASPFTIERPLPVGFVELRFTALAASKDVAVTIDLKDAQGTPWITFNCAQRFLPASSPWCWSQAQFDFASNDPPARIEVQGLRFGAAEAGWKVRDLELVGLRKR